MTIATPAEIASNQTFPPRGERNRLSEIQMNRQLYKGELNSLQVNQQSLDVKGAKFNWFRRIPHFYAELMFGSPPEPELREGRVTDRTTEWLRAQMPNVADVYHRVLIDMIRYGTGVPVVQPLLGQLVAYQPDSWYTYNGGDVIANVTARPLVVARETLPVSGPSGTDYEQLALVRLLLTEEGKGDERLYEFQGSSVGDEIDGSRREFDSIGIPLVYPVYHGYATDNHGQSLYDDIKYNINEIVLRMQGLSRTLERNQRPHMFGPVSAVKTDASGNPEINSQGQFFPLAPEDQIPGYITWDSGTEAVQMDISKNMDWILAASGLSSLLFSARDGEARINLASGKALKRAVVQTFAKMEHYKRQLEQSMKHSLVALAAVQGNLGMERISPRVEDIEFRWGYEDLFMDDEQAVPGDRSSTGDSGGD